MKLNRKWLMVIALVMSLTMATAGTLAYLSDTDADVNVMTLGSVYIVQNEQQRDENGNLEPFEQNKPALPAVYDNIEWENDGIEFNGEKYNVFSDKVENVIDKFVTVTNTGKSDAYVRTIVAMEAPDYDAKDLIHVNVNGDEDVLTFEGWKPVDIGNEKYVYAVFTYKEALAPNETSAPSLMQLFLDKVTTNEDVAKLGDTWEVQVLSQAVQTQGFSDAKTALDEAFGEVNPANLNKWLGETEIGSPGDKNDTNNPPEVIDTEEELKAALKAGGNVTMGGDITLTEGIEVAGRMVLNLNGYKLTVGNLGMKVQPGSTVTLSNGDVDAGISGDPTIWVEEDATIEFNNVNIVAKKTGEDTTDTPEMFPLYVVGGSVVMNGGSLVNEVDNPDGWNYGVIISNGSFTMNSGKISIKNGGIIPNDPNRTASIAFATAGNTTINYNGGKLDASRWIFTMNNGTVVNSFDSAFDSSKCWQTNSGIIPTFNYTSN